MNILISPLNWGLGHATRIVPIINELSKKHNITIAANGAAFDFLKFYFPLLKIEKNHSFSFYYSKNDKLISVVVFLQLYKLIILYFQNKKWVRNYEKTNKVDLIISDNNFGFYSKKTKSVFITHQINIQSKSKLLMKITFWLNKKNIQKFSHCLIPDNCLQFKISGELSNISKLNIPYTYIGILTHMHNTQTQAYNKKIDILCLISGIEPQRTILEEIFFNTFKDTTLQTIIVGGKKITTIDTKNHNIHYFSFADSQTIANLINSAKLIIARSGYSTICDLIYCKKTAILIPTPKQTEQEYLAKYLYNNKLFYFLKQKELNLENILYFSSIKNKYQQNVENLNIEFFESEKLNFLL